MGVGDEADAQGLPPLEIPEAGPDPISATHPARARAPTQWDGLSLLALVHISTDHIIILSNRLGLEVAPWLLLVSSAVSMSGGRRSWRRSPTAGGGSWPAAIAPPALRRAPMRSSGEWPRPFWRPWGRWDRGPRASPEWAWP